MAGRTYAFVTVQGERIVGSTRFMDIDYWQESPVPSVLEIGGTWLSASAQRTAANTEAKLLMLTYTFDTWNVHRGPSRLTLATNVHAGPSNKSARGSKVSAGRIRRPPDGTIRDSAYFSIIASEWPVVKRHLCTLLDR